MYRCEAFNSLVRHQNVYSNRHNPSRDIAVGFSVREHLTYVVSGGLYGPNNERLVTIIILVTKMMYEILMIYSCSATVRALFRNPEVLQFMNGYTPRTHTIGEFGKLEVSILIYHALMLFTMAISTRHHGRSKSCPMCSYVLSVSRAVHLAVF